MSLDKAITYKKEFRQHYRKSKRFDRTCRNHGSCPYCHNNRRAHDKRIEIRAKQIMEEDTDTLQQRYDDWMEHCLRWNEIIQALYDSARLTDEEYDALDAELEELRPKVYNHQRWTIE